MQSPLLSVPSKKCEAVDFEAPFKDCISSVYSEDSSKYTAEIQLLNRVRQDMRGAGSDMTGRDLTYKYYGQLELLDLRFSIEEKKVKVLFTWYDAFTKSETSQYSVAYEKACVIFNIGAICSQIAALQLRSQPSGQKTAFNYFQAAAGMFKYINDNFLHPPSTDLSKESINVLIDICLGQSQETFIEKVLSEKKKGNLVSKLAYSCSELYLKALQGMDSEDLYDQFDDEWRQICKLKAKYFESLGHFHKAQHLQQESKFGISVAHFTLAENLVKEAHHIVTPNQSSIFSKSDVISESNRNALVEFTSNLLAQVQEQKRIAVKDNDVIYHEAVPPLDILQLEKLVAVKPISFAEICTGGQQEIPKIIGPDIFSKLIPLQIHESASLYSEEKSKLLRAERERAELTDHELAATLDSLKLNDISNLLKSSPLERNQEFLDQLQSLQKRDFNAELESKKQTLALNISQCSSLLEKEEQEYQDAKSKFPHILVVPSIDANSSLKTDLNRIQNSLLEALKADQLLITHANQLSFLQIESFATEFTKRINSDSMSLIDSPSQTVDFKEIDSLVAHLKALKQERSQILQDLKTMIHSEDISQLLLLNAGRETQVFQTEIQKFKVFSTKMNENLAKNASVLQQLSKKYDSIRESSAIKTLTEQEKNVQLLVDEWTAQYTAYLDMISQLDQGLGFYQEMQVRTGALLEKIRTFSSKRSFEIKTAVDRANALHLERQMAAMSVQPTPPAYHQPSPATVPSYHQPTPPPPVPQYYQSAPPALPHYSPRPSAVPPAHHYQPVPPALPHYQAPPQQQFQQQYQQPPPQQPHYQSLPFNQYPPVPGYQQAGLQRPAVPPKVPQSNPYDNIHRRNL